MPFNDRRYAARIGVARPSASPATRPGAAVGTADPGGQRGRGGGRYTVIPHVARGFVSCRLVGDQDPERVLAAVRDHVARPGHARCARSVAQDGGAVPAYRIDRCTRDRRGHPALRTVYPGEEVLHAVIAGTLPATTLFERVLGAKTLFFSFSTADEKLHAPNEFLRLHRIHEGMRAWDALLVSMADGPHRLGGNRARASGGHGMTGTA